MRLSKRRLSNIFNKTLVRFFLIFIGVMLVAYAIGIILDRESTADKIAIIPVKGLITTDGGQISPYMMETVSSTKIIEFIEVANKDKNIKGIILEIDSPGGAVVATKEIVDAVKKIDKPVVSWIREVGASGAYWIASGSDHIVADPLSITGSIGVTSGFLEFSGLFEEYGINYERLVAGEYKDAGSPFRGLKEEERRLLQSKLNKIHNYFIKDVAKNRDLDERVVRELANGIFYLGEEAYELKLIDSLGGKEEAINIVKEKAGIKEAKIVIYQEKKRLFSLLRWLGPSSLYSIGRGIGAELKDRGSLISI